MQIARERGCVVCGVPLRGLNGEAAAGSWVALPGYFRLCDTRKPPGDWVRRAANRFVFGSFSVCIGILLGLILGLRIGGELRLPEGWALGEKIGKSSGVESQ
jgi:hypothetical protein